MTTAFARKIAVQVPDFPCSSVGEWPMHVHVYALAPNLSVPRLCPMLCSVRASSRRPRHGKGGDASHRDPAHHGGDGDRMFTSS
jgi:hypothetical protein